jgi:hypothetical protein
MTSPLPLQSIQRDREAHQSDNEVCTAVCLTSSFELSGFGEIAGGKIERWGLSAADGFLIGIAFTCPEQRRLILAQRRTQNGQN